MAKDEEEIDDKAGYNQAARITEILAMLRNTYVTSMIYDDLPSALKICRRVLDIISARIKAEEIKETNKTIKEIKGLIPAAKETYVHEGGRFVKNPTKREKVEEEIENLWRSLEKLQDMYGYGMFSEDESGL